MTREIVIGAGPAGLAVAAELTRAGRNPIVLERADSAGSSWLSRYDNLRLNTARWWSQLPGLPIPREYGTWVSARDYATYLETYARHHELDIRFGVWAEKLTAGDHGWIVETSAGRFPAETVVVATGYDREAFVPFWPGRERFRGSLLHSSAYRNAQPFARQSVLVVGPGNSGTDIAVDLARGGASQVWLSIRTPPQIVPRTVGPIPIQTVAVATRPLPAWAGDSIVRFVQRAVHGDLRPYGLPPATEALSTQFARGDVVPVIDVSFVRELKRSRVNIVSAVAGFDATHVLLADGSRVAPEAVIAATGYRRGLEPLVGHLGVLDDRGRPFAGKLPGLHFAGYANPLSGNLRELGIHARDITKEILQPASLPQRRRQTVLFRVTRQPTANTNRDF